MLLFYVRHGDPIYNPDQLTPLGERQAESVAKRLSLYGVDRIYASTSTRARQTAKPLCEMLKKDMTLLDFANEGHAYDDFSIIDENGDRIWAIAKLENRRLMASAGMRRLGFDWYTHPDLPDCNWEGGFQRIQEETDKFLFSLGYQHIKESGTYQILKPNEERIALFAHHHFGVGFFSALLDIPYPICLTQFEMCHTGMTVIYFPEGTDGLTTPQILTLSNDSHLYRDGLPMKYNNLYYF